MWVYDVHDAERSLFLSCNMCRTDKLLCTGHHIMTRQRLLSCWSARAQIVTSKIRWVWELTLQICWDWVTLNQGVSHFDVWHTSPHDNHQTIARTPDVRYMSTCTATTWVVKPWQSIRQILSKLDNVLRLHACSSASIPPVTVEICTYLCLWLTKVRIMRDLD